MPIPLIIGAGSGLISAALFASAATATALAGVLFYLAPLPICLAGLGWGGTAALVSALIGTVVVAASLGPATAAIFAVSIGAPMVLLVASCAAVAARRHAAGTSRRRARMVSARPPRRLGGADRGAARRPAGADPGLRPGQLSRLDPRDPQPQRAERTRSRWHAVHRGEHRQSLGHDRPGAARRLRHHLAHHHPVQSLDGRADRRCLGACAQAVARICMRSSFPTPCCSCSPPRLLHLSCRGCRACSRPGSPARCCSPTCCRGSR